MYIIYSHMCLVNRECKICLQIISKYAASIGIVILLRSSPSLVMQKAGTSIYSKKRHREREILRYKRKTIACSVCDKENQGFAD